jgi:uncharacterized damage-inducible protein DinB
MNIMKKSFLTLALLFVAVAAFCQGQVQKESSGLIAFAGSQTMQLAQAIPAEKYAWSPGTGVRSVSETFAHIIAANYMFAAKLGGTVPAELKLESLEKDLKTKDAIAAELKRSFDLIVNTVKNTKDDMLAKKVEFPFPGEFTGMSAALISVGHTNEHLGQLIAYARMNGITPPWNDKK